MAKVPMLLGEKLEERKEEETKRGDQKGKCKSVRSAL